MNKEQLKQCIDAYGTDIFAFCSRITCNRQEAEDLYQDTFLKAVELGENMDETRNPKSYLVSIAIRIWKNRKRKFAWRKRIAGEQTLMEETLGENALNSGDFSGDYVSSPEEFLLNREVTFEVRKAVAKLEEKYRMPVYLFYTMEFSIGQIAQIMKLPKGTVKSRLYKARKLLKEELEVVLDET